MVSVVAAWLERGNCVPSHSETSSSLLSVPVLHVRLLARRKER